MSARESINTFGVYKQQRARIERQRFQRERLLLRKPSSGPAQPGRRLGRTPLASVFSCSSEAAATLRRRRKLS
jgi:hypothetical protein